MRHLRIAALAAVPLLLGTAPAPDQSAGAKEQPGQGEGAQSLRDIAAAQDKLAEAANAGERQRPCEYDKPDYSSELCAQWYAARATKEAADWSKWTLWISFFGAFSTIVALFLSWHSIRIARDATRRQLRAHVGIHRITFNKKGIAFTVKNHGTTPACNVSIVTVHKYDDVAPVETRHEFGIVDPGEAPGLIPMDETTVTKARNAKDASIAVTINYDDNMGGRWVREGCFLRSEFGRKHQDQRFYIREGTAKEVKRLPG